MKFIRANIALCLSLLMFSSLASANDYTSDKRVDLIKEKLQNGSERVCEELHGSKIHDKCRANILITKDKSINAWFRGGNIYLTSKVVSELSDDELAFIISHEMSHIILGHKRSSIDNEHAADYLAAKIMKNSNLDPMAAELVLARGQARRLLGFPLSLLTHPSNSSRMRTIMEAINE